LTERVRRKPYSVVLLDEIEKAHPEVFNILLQLLDDGQLTDSFGRKVDFKNTVVIMTSNIGTRQIGDSKSVGFDKIQVSQDYDAMKSKIGDEVKKLFNPEMLNRIDELVYFRALTIDHIKQIIDILLVDLANRLAEKGISFKLTSPAKDWLADKGFEPQYGARPLKRALQKYLEDPLAEEILRGQYAGDCEVEIIVADDKEQLGFNIHPGRKEEESERIDTVNSK
jgi:ATP-dependent Clp protease ATP-binding subunit ClpC